MLGQIALVGVKVVDETLAHHKHRSDGTGFLFVVPELFVVVVVVLEGVVVCAASRDDRGVLLRVLEGRI